MEGDNDDVAEEDSCDEHEDGDDDVDDSIAEDVKRLEGRLRTSGRCLSTGGPL